MCGQLAGNVVNATADGLYLNKLSKSLGGKSIGDNVSETIDAGGAKLGEALTPKAGTSRFKGRTTVGNTTRLALGTQVGGATRRKPLGSTEPTAGLNI
jgi:hypothetical protein